MAGHGRVECPERAASFIARVEGLHVSYVYILRCSDQTLYIGHTNDLRAREDAHNRGFGSRYTARRRPVRIVYVEEFQWVGDAVTRERQLKGWTAAKKEALIAGNLERLKTPSTGRR
jgi:putative endonuclease